MSDRINTRGKVLKPFLLGVLTVMVVQVIGVVIVVMMGLIPANADARPSRLEARLAGLVREAYVTRAVQTTDVTVNPTEANLSDGAKTRQGRPRQGGIAADVKIERSTEWPALWRTTRGLLAYPELSDPRLERLERTYPHHVPRRLRLEDHLVRGEGGDPSLFMAQGSSSSTPRRQLAATIGCYARRR